MLQLLAIFLTVTFLTLICMVIFCRSLLSKERGKGTQPAHARVRLCETII